MSSSDNTHDHHDHEHHDEQGGAFHATLKGYATGLILSIILTVIPFWLVMDHVIQSPAATGLTIMAFAGVQIIVHMIFFLHLDFRSESGWTALATIFTVIVVFIVLLGSIWVMYHANANMMPGIMEHYNRGA